MGNLLKISAIVLISVLLLLIVAILIFTTPPGENMLEDWLEARLSDEVGLSVSIGKFETNFWSRVQLVDLIVAPVLEAEGTPLLYVQHLRLRYSLSGLLGETTTLKALVVDSMAIGIEIDSLGQFGVPMFDVPTPSVKGTGEPAASVVIDSIMLGQIGLTYLDSELPLSVNVSGMVLSARGRSDGGYSGRVTTSDVLAAYDGLNVSLHDLDVAASLTSDAARIEYARAVCDGLHLDLTGEVGLTGRQELGLEVTAEGSLDGLATAISEAYGAALPASGLVRVDCQVEGSLDEPRMFLTGELTQLALPSLLVDSAIVQAHYSRGELIVDEFWLLALGGTISGSAGTVLDSIATTTIDLTMKGIGLPDIWRALYAEVSPYGGRLDGTIEVRGTGSDWTSWAVDAVVDGTNLRYDDQPIPDLSCEARLDSGRTLLLVTHGTDEIRADLKLSADSVKGKFDVAVPNLTALARLLHQPELSGGFWASGDIDGSFVNPVMTASITGSKLNYRNFPVDSLVAVVSYEDSMLTLIDFMCEGGLDSINSEHSPFDIDSIGGALNYVSRLSGAMDNLQGNLFINMVAPRCAGYEVDSLAATVMLNGSQIEVTRLEASRGDVAAALAAVYDTTSGTGSFDLLLVPLLERLVDNYEGEHGSSAARDGYGSVSGEFTVRSDSDLRADVSARGLWLGLLPMLFEDSLRLDGEVEFDLALQGPYLTPNASLVGKVRSLAVSGYGVDSIVTGLRLDSEALRLDSLTAYTLGHTLHASGKLDLSVGEDGSLEVSTDGAMEAMLDTRDFDMSALGGLVLPDGELTGMFSALLRVSGAISSPDFDGWLTARKVRVLLDSTSVPLEGVELALTFADTVLMVDSLSGEISGIPLRANGMVTTARFNSAAVDFDVRVGSAGKLSVVGEVSDTSLSLELVSDTLNLRIFQPFLPRLDSLQGMLGSHMRVGGSLTSPVLDGTVRATSVGLMLPRYNIRCSNGYADILFDRDHVIIDSASAAINDGGLLLSGSLTHDQGEPLDIKLHAQAGNIVLERPGIYTVEIDTASINYGKQHENYVLDGDLVLGEARFTAGVRPTSVLPWVQSIETVDMELPELLARSRIDVRIRESNNIWVDNNLARIRLRAELGIIGTPLRPNLTGIVRVEEGYLLYLDRRFQVNEGSVYFNDPARFNPDINLDASTRVTVYRRATAEPYTVYIRAEGLLDQLQYGLNSQPVLERPDIVALLTLGATRSELTRNGENGGGGMTQVLKDRAAMLTSQRVSGFLSRKAGSMFGFDEFTIKGNLFQFDDNWGPQLVASKRLSQKIDFTYATTVGQLNDQMVKLGYRFTPLWSLMGETDREGRSGIDLKFGIRFK